MARGKTDSKTHKSISRPRSSRATPQKAPKGGWVGKAHESVSQRARTSTLTLRCFQRESKESKESSKLDKVANVHSTISFVRRPSHKLDKLRAKRIVDQTSNGLVISRYSNCRAHLSSSVGGTELKSRLLIGNAMHTTLKRNCLLATQKCK